MNLVTVDLQLLLYKHLIKNSYDGGTSNIKGVNLYSSTGKWQAQIQSKGIKQNLGYYDTEELAKQAYLKEYNKILLELEQETKLLQRKKLPYVDNY